MTSRLRADAARNRAQILAAARDAFRESGTAVALDEIASRAGVSIATLYRRFPDREALIRQVHLDGFHIVLDKAQAALAAAAADPLGAIERYLLDLIARRDELVLPLIGGPLPGDREIVGLQERIADALEGILAAGRAAGVISAQITVADLVTESVLVCRPLPHLRPDQAEALAVRQVRIFLGGLHLDTVQHLPPAPSYQELTARLRVSAGADDASV